MILASTALRLAAYVERYASRPALKRALDAHLQDLQSPI
jgi:hypothetical protein